MTPQELLELAALDAFGLLDEHESRLYSESFHDAPAVVQDQIVRLQADLAADEALLQGKEYGLRLTENSYQIVVFNESKQRWQADDANAFKNHLLPDNTTLSLESEGNKISLEEVLNVTLQDHEKPEDDPLKPALLILSSGEMTPFEIHFQSPSTTSRVTLRSDGLDDIELQTQHE